MENKQFPELDPQDPIPELTPEVPEEPPVVTELTFDSDPQPIPPERISDASDPQPLEELTSDEAPVQPNPLPEEPPVPEEAAVPEESPVSEEAAVLDEAPALQEAPVPEEGPIPQELPVPETVPMTEAAPIAPETSPDIPVQEPVIDDPLDMESLLSILEEPTTAPEEPPVEDAIDQEYRDNGKEFDTLFNASAKKEVKKPDVQRPSQKGRPKKKKGDGLFGIPNLVVTVVWLALILVIGTTLGRMLWVSAADVLAFGREDKAVTVTIYEADTMDDIVDKLYDAGLIRYKSLFNLYASISDAEEDIKPGIYDLNTRYDYHALVNFMSPRSSREVIKLTIPEGYTCRQIFSLLEENRICTAVDLGAYAAAGELSDYWFLEGVERGAENSLEGYLFPDTYEFYKNSTPREALEKMLDNFNNRFTEEMRAQLDALNANVTGGGYTVREITIIASLIEKESAAPAESAQIAGVIYNRLFNWEYPALLNIDAAIVYAQGGEAETIDTNLDSPYNTYTHVGLTPGPIANPGLSSLQAALNPASHNYYYYVLNPETGMHTFSTTQEEHNANIAAFYN